MTTIAKPLPHVTVVQLPVDALHALAAGDRATASSLLGLDVPDELVEPTNRDTWVRRSTQASTDPRHQAWVTGLLVDVDSGCVVGNAGFHAPPGAPVPAELEGRPGFAAGTVEIGYTVARNYRGRGYAKAATRWLLDRAGREPEVTGVRACIQATNTASLAVIRGAGFDHVGEEWDEDDGVMELVFYRRTT